MPQKKPKKNSKDFQKVYFIMEWKIFSGKVYETKENGTTDVEILYIANKKVEPFMVNVKTTLLREDKMIYADEFC